MLKALLLLLKGGKLGSVMLTCGSMLVSIVFYGRLFGWQYGVGFVLLILVHEMGHFIAARQRGLKVGLPTFIPFIGAWVALKDKPHNVETEAYVGLAGPLIGSLGALACYYAGRSYDSHLLLALSYAGFMINLANLIPIKPLDGGRVTAVLSPRIWLFGAPLLFAYYLWNHNPLLLLIGFAAYPQLRRAWSYKPEDPANAAYYSITGEQRLFYTIFYLLLVGFLALMANDVGAGLGFAHWNGHGFSPGVGGQINGSGGGGQINTPGGGGQADLPDDGD